MICISCGEHYKLTKDYNDPLECESCVGTLDDLSYGEEDYTEEVTTDNEVIGEGCYRSLVVRYD